MLRLLIVLDRLTCHPPYPRDPRCPTSLQAGHLSHTGLNTRVLNRLMRAGAGCGSGLLEAHVLVVVLVVVVVLVLVLVAGAGAGLCGLLPVWICSE